MSRLTCPCGVDILQLFVTRHRATEMWRRLWKPLVIVLPPATIVLAVLYVIYRLVDPLPPRHLAIAAGAPGSGYDNFARQYARILARHGVELEIRNSAGAEIESAVRLLKIARPFEVDLQRLRIHLRMVQEDISRMRPGNAAAIRPSARMSDEYDDDHVRQN
jgi:hypothetical protein